MAERLDLQPSGLETRVAIAAFVQTLLDCENVVRLPAGHPGGITPQAALTRALSEVWRQGRIFQRDQDAKALYALASQETPSMESLFAGKEARR